MNMNILVFWQWRQSVHYSRQQGLVKNTTYLKIIIQTSHLTRWKAEGQTRQVYYNGKGSFGIFPSGVISQVVSGGGGLIKQGPRYM